MLLAVDLVYEIVFFLGELFICIHCIFQVSFGLGIVLFQQFDVILILSGNLVVYIDNILYLCSLIYVYRWDNPVVEVLGCPSEVEFEFVDVLFCLCCSFALVVSEDLLVV